MRYLLLSLLIIVFNMQNLTFAYNTSSYTPIEANNITNSSYPQITQLEKIILKRSYDKEPLQTRLDRIEQKLYAKTYPEADYSWRVENISSTINQNQLYHISSRNLSSIEKKVFGTSFPKDTTETRLSRLEKELFGAIQSGKLNQRYEMLLSATKYDDNQQFQITEENNNNLKTGIKSFFSQGFMTGYTPPIAPYGYSNPYGFNNLYGANPIYQRATYNPYVTNKLIQNFIPNNKYFSPYPHPHRHNAPINYPHYVHGQYPTYINSTVAPSCSCGVHILD